MIGKLRGVIDAKAEDHVILDVHGVGYVVHCSPRILQSLPPTGEAATLAIETQVREDSIKLYGFASDAERDWFRLLQSVQGVGARVALAIQGALSANDLTAAIASQDRTALARAPGVGPKLAARIVAELKDRAPAFGAADLAFAAPAGADAPVGSAAADAVSALINLGYGRSQAAVAVAASIRTLGEDASTRDLIKQGLKTLAEGAA